MEGVARIRVERITQERPFFEAEVTYEYDDGEDFVPKQMESYADSLKLFLQKT